jgi:hypothetical protein
MGRISPLGQRLKLAVQARRAPAPRTVSFWRRPNFRNWRISDRHPWLPAGRRLCTFGTAHLPIIGNSRKHSESVRKRKAGAFCERGFSSLKTASSRPFSDAALAVNT